MPDHHAWVAARRGLNDAETATFDWPLEEASPLRASKVIPANLLN
jgi:hypothetical protein